MEVEAKADSKVSMEVDKEKAEEAKDDGLPGWWHHYVKTAEMEPLREMPDAEEMERPIKEEDIGLTQFVNPKVEGFEAIVKHRYSDFSVNELDPEGNVVRIRSKDLLVSEREKEEEEAAKKRKEEEAANGGPKYPKHSELPDEDRRLVTSFQWIRMTELAKKYLGEGRPSDGSDVVTVDVTQKDKEERKRIHELVRRVFPHLSSDTPQHPDDAGKKLLRVLFSRKLAKQERQRTGSKWPEDRPPYLHFTLYKEDQDTTLVVNALSNALRCGGKAKTVSFAGTKDKRARTAQKVCVSKVTPKELVAALHKARLKLKRGSREPIAVAGDFAYAEAPLRLGDHSGNRFSIVLRNCSSESGDVTSAVDAAFKSLKEGGYINYFGPQRFGTTSVRTSDVGLAVISGRWEEAVDLILKPRANEQFALSMARRVWWQYRDPHKAVKTLGSRFQNMTEYKLLLGLKLGKNDYVKAMNVLPLNQRLIYLHAYQSVVWNRVVSRRIAEYGEKVLVGDLYRTADKNEEEESDSSEAANGEGDGESETAEDAGPKRKEDQVSVVTEEDISSVSRFDVVMPLPGCRVKYPENVMRDWYAEELANDGLDIETAFDNKAQKAYSLGGDYRKVWAMARDLEWRHVRYSEPNKTLSLSDVERLEEGAAEVKSEPDGDYHGVVVDMSLSSSSYATMALREATKMDTGKAKQSELTAKHLKEHEDKVKAKEEEEKKEGGEEANGEGEPPCKKVKSE